MPGASNKEQQRGAAAAGKHIGEGEKSFAGAKNMREKENGAVWRSLMEGRNPLGSAKTSPHKARRERT